MKKRIRTTGVALMFSTLVLMTGCVNPDGSQNNTATGALIGGAIGALAGAAAGGGRHEGQGMFIGAALGTISGAVVGSLMDEQQRERLRQQSPQTLQTVQHNEELASQPAPPPSATGPPAPPAEAPTPLKVDDIKALAAAGVKPDAIIQAIKDSKATAYSMADIEAAQSASPPVDPEVIAFMKNPAA